MLEHKAESANGHAYSNLGGLGFPLEPGLELVIGLVLVLGLGLGLGSLLSLSLRMDPTTPPPSLSLSRCHYTLANFPHLQPDPPSKHRDLPEGLRANQAHIALRP